MSNADRKKSGSSGRNILDDESNPLGLDLTPTEKEYYASRARHRKRIIRSAQFMISLLAFCAVMVFISHGLNWGEPWDSIVIYSYVGSGVLCMAFTLAMMFRLR
jgi:hypothetical protein